MVSSQKAQYPEKGHCTSIWYFLVVLDGAQRVHVAPKFEQVMGQTHQTPLTTDIVQAAQQKPAETPRFFDLSKHRFHDHFTPGIQGSSCGGRTFAAMHSCAVTGGSVTAASGTWWRWRPVAL
jgi:hypothetical protein